MGYLIGSNIFEDPARMETRFGDRVIQAMADEETFQRINEAVECGMWRPVSMPAYDMNNTNVNYSLRAGSRP